MTVLWPLLCELIDISSIQFSRSVVSNSGLQHTRLPIHHQLLELAQTHGHWVIQAIQPSHPLSSPFPPAFPTFNLAQHQGLSQWVSSLHQVAKSIGVSASASVLSMNIQDWFPLGWTGWVSLQSKWLWRVFSNTAGQKHQFFSAQPSL